MVSNRFKLVLPSIFDEDQTSENTGMVYDTIDYCEAEQKKGVLIILDFSKAFDTIEWTFI